MDEAPWPTLLFKLPCMSLFGVTLVLFLLKVEGFGSTLERPQKPGRLLGTFSLEPFLGFRSGGMLVKEL